MKCVHRIKCVKVRPLFEKNKVRFARADQLCFIANINDECYIFLLTICHTTRRQMQIRIITSDSAKK
jgi:hypothetical protein